MTGTEGTRTGKPSWEEHNAGLRAEERRKNVEAARHDEQTRRWQGRPKDKEEEERWLAEEREWAAEDFD